MLGIEAQMYSTNFKEKHNSNGGGGGAPWDFKA